jgi:hypothetical protein
MQLGTQALQNFAGWGGVQIRRGLTGTRAEDADRPASVFKLIAQSRYLQLIIGLLALMSIVTTITDYQFSAIVQADPRFMRPDGGQIAKGRYGIEAGTRVATLRSFLRCIAGTCRRKSDHRDTSKYSLATHLLDEEETCGAGIRPFTERERERNAVTLPGG